MPETVVGENKKHFWACDYHPEKDYIYAGHTSKKTQAFIHVHKKGLLLQVRPKPELNTKGRRIINRENRPKNVVIPGEYTLREVALYIASVTGTDFKPKRISLANGATIKIGKLHRIKQISKTLMSSGIWKRRGRLSWKDVPPKFFKSLPLREFVKGSTHSYKVWWRIYCAKIAKSGGVIFVPYKRTKADERVYDGINCRNQDAWQTAYNKWLNRYKAVSEMIETGKLPEKLHCVRGWDKIPISDLLKFFTANAHKHKWWGMYVAQVHRVFYKNYLKKHVGNFYFERNDEPLLIQYLARCPKTASFCSLLDSAANFGCRSHSLVELNVTKANDMKRVIEALKLYEEIRRASSYRILNRNYKPPTLSLPDGWVWANHDTFRMLSDDYRCCISRGSHYEGSIVEGLAHVIYRPDRQDRGGGLAFLKFQQLRRDVRHRFNGPEEQVENRDLVWTLSEIKGFANEDVHPAFEADAASVVDDLNTLTPGAYPPVDQDMAYDALKEDALREPLTARVFQVMDADTRAGRRRAQAVPIEPDREIPHLEAA